MSDIKKFLMVLIVLYPVLLLGQSLKLYHGIISLIPNPCTTDPCLPCISWSLETDTANFVLTNNGFWICENLIINGVEYFENDTVTISGTDTIKFDIDSVPYYELEIDEVITSREETQYSNIKIYPNPIDILLCIDSKLTINSIDLINTSGILIKQWRGINVTSYTIDLNWINNGVFILKIDYIGNYNSEIFKLIK